MQVAKHHQFGLKNIKSGSPGIECPCIIYDSRATLLLSGSPTQLNKEARSWRVRSKLLLDCVFELKNGVFMDRPCHLENRLPFLNRVEV